MNLVFVAIAYIMGSLVMYLYYRGKVRINTELLEKYKKLEEENYKLSKDLNRFLYAADVEVMDIVMNYYETVLKNLRGIAQERFSKKEVK